MENENEVVEGKVRQLSTDHASPLDLALEKPGIMFKDVGICLALACVGGYGLYLHATGRADVDTMFALRRVYLLGIFISTIAANFLVAAKVTR